MTSRMTMVSEEELY